MESSVENASSFINKDPLAGDRVKNTLNVDIMKNTIDFSVYDIPEEPEKEKTNVLEQVGKGLGEAKDKVADGWEKVSPQLKQGAEKAGKTVSEIAENVKKSVASHTDGKTMTERYKAVLDAEKAKRKRE